MKCFIPAGLIAATLLFGCSDEREPTPPTADGGAKIDVNADQEGGATADVSVDTPRTDGPFDLFDVFPLPDAGCPNCIRDRCGSQINSCINDPACVMGLTCTLQNCAGALGEGGLNPSALLCVLNCFGGDQAKAFAAIGSLTCLTMTCGSVCIPDAGGGLIDVRPPPDANDVSVDHAPDGESDASTPDATDNDVSSPDAAPDTHEPDAIAPDANPQDARTPDADAANDAQHDDVDGATNDAEADAADTSSDDARDGSDATPDSATPDDAGTD